MPSCSNPDFPEKRNAIEQEGTEATEKENDPTDHLVQSDDDDVIVPGVGFGEHLNGHAG